MMVGTGHSGQFGLTCQTGHVCLDRTDRIGLQGQDNKDRTAASEELWTRLLGQGSWDKEIWDRGQLEQGQPGQDNPGGQPWHYKLDKHSGTGRLGQVSYDRSDWTSRSVKVTRTGQREQDGQDMTMFGKCKFSQKCVWKTKIFVTFPLKSCCKNQHLVEISDFDENFWEKVLRKRTIRETIFRLIFALRK